MIKRKIKDKIVKSLKLKEITIITGARQIGKTTLVKEIIKDLNKKGKRTLYFNLDVEEDSEHFDSQAKLLNKIRLEVGSERAYIFIDEIQQKENAGRFLKGIYDMDLPYKFIVTGSGSLELKERISEALTGRKYLIQMSSVSFLEFLNHKTNYKYQDRLSLFFETEGQKTELLLNEYLVFGGYPAVVTADTISRKQEIMNEVFTSVITKDISYLLNVRQPDKFIKLIQLLAAQQGGLLNYSQLAQDVGLKLETLKTYLWYAEQIFIITIVKPYFTNLKKEITKSPTFYFNDMGMLNFVKNKLVTSPEDGFLFQNFVYLILKEKFDNGLARINYWRTKDKAEVDFILHAGQDVIPVEVKYKKMKQPVLSRSYQSFLKKYAPAKGIVVNMELDETVVINGTQVFFLPFWKLLVSDEI
jgi:predicted AAA+ superfamily ATPase